MFSYTVIMDVDSYEIEAKSHVAAVRRVKADAKEAYQNRNKTNFVSVSIDFNPKRGPARTIFNKTVSVHPSEPPCKGAQHNWKAPYEIVGGVRENPGVFGSGGGVLITEVCVNCGCGRRTDTWAQNPSNGEQGLTSISYVEDEFEV